jgi:uncharacterized heparinase superfamily protein
MEVIAAMSRNLRAVAKTVWRAGLRRSLYRLRRLLQLRLLDPCFGTRLYRAPSVSEPFSLQDGQRRILAYLAQLRCASPLASAWDRSDGTLSLLGQRGFLLEAGTDWQTRPVADPLWAFQLHAWEWAWPALVDADGESQTSLLSLWQDWIARVPVGRGLAWEPYPTCRRLVTWSSAWHLLGGDTELAAAIAQGTAYLADHLERDLDNNHLVANAKALAWVGLLFPNLPQAPHWRCLGLELLWSSLATQVRGDGGHVENATSYHKAVWLDGLETALLCQASGVPVPSDVWERLDQIGDFALALRRPDGRLPLLNDSVEDEPLPVGALFALAARTFEQADCTWDASEGNIPSSEIGNRVLSDSGYAVFRSGVAADDTFLVFDAGDLGPAHCPGHGHADALSLELWGCGEALIVDPGTYQYPAGRWRDYFRSTVAHSTATVDGVEQSHFVGPFRVVDMARGRIVDARLDGAAAEVVGEHDGYTRLADPVIHRRCVRFRNPGLIEVEDLFLGASRHQLDLRFHLASCCVVCDGSGSAQASYPGGTRLAFQVSSSEPGALSVEQGWVSRRWYQKEASPVLTYALETQLPVRITTHLRIA